MFIILYVSRFVGVNRYGVIDTDTGEETIYTLKSLAKLAESTTVKGVSRIDCASLGLANASERKRLRYEMQVSPCQPRSTLTKAQMKAKVLKPYFRTVLTNSQVCLIRVAWEKVPPSAKVRISDFGTKLEDFIFKTAYGDRGFSASSEITIVLDDKVSISDSAFSLNHPEHFGLAFVELGIKIDLRDVTDDALAECVYSSVWENRASVDDFAAIIDNEERKALIVKRFEAIELCCALLKCCALILAFIPMVAFGVIYKLTHSRRDGFPPVFVVLLFGICCAMTWIFGLI